MLREEIMTNHQVNQPTLRHFIWMGSSRFCLAGGVVFATVAFGQGGLYQHLGVYGAYLFWTFLFILLGGALFSGLIMGPNRLVRAYGLFGLGFFLYAAAWVAAYFTVRGLPGEALGSLLGPVLMALGFMMVLGTRQALSKIIAGLVIAHSVGYFLGRPLLGILGEQLGMICWGLIYGLGFGAGLGYALFMAQTPLAE